MVDDHEDHTHALEVLDDNTHDRVQLSDRRGGRIDPADLTIAAYQHTRNWMLSNGAAGLPCVRLGRSVRVPTAVIQQLVDATLDTGGSRSA